MAERGIDESAVGGHSYGKVELSGTSTAQLGDFYHIEHHYHNLEPRSSNDYSSSHRSDLLTSHSYGSAFIAGTSLPATSSLSMIRTRSHHDDHISRRGSEGQQPWVTTLEKLQCRANVELKDRGLDGTAMKRKYPVCEVSIEVMGTDLIANFRRRVVITHNDSQPGAREVFWIPATLNKVSRTKTIVETQFSNCIQMAHTSEEYLDSYDAIYEPATPNVYMKFNFQDDSSAVQFQSRLLHLEGPSAPRDKKEAVFSQYCTIRHGPLESANRHTIGHGLFVWRQIRAGKDEQECVVLDLGCFRSQTDFTIEIDESEAIFTLYIKNLTKIKYEPTKPRGYSYWPTPEVEENESGAPARVKLGVDGDDDTLRIEAPRACLIDLLSSTVGRRSGLVIHEWFQIDYVVNPKKIGRNKQEQGQLTLWDKDGCLYGLLRITSSDQNVENLDKSQQPWRALHWKPDLCQPPKFSDKYRVTFEELETMTGDCLSLESKTTLEPRTKNDKFKNSQWDTVKIELRFQRDEHLRRVKSYLKKYGLS